MANNKLHGADVQEAKTDFQESYITLFDELFEAFSLFPDVEKIYQGYSAVFYKILTFNTQFVTIKFKGTYAKVAYLLKEHKASAYVRWIVNDMRTRIRRFNENNRDEELNEELKANYRYDFEALCRFIALIYECQIPNGFCETFPSRGERKDYGKLIEGTDCLRIIVERWADGYVYGTINGEENEIKASYGHSLYDNDNCCWNYIEEYLFEGCQLNLVRPRTKDGVIVPELIIFEPDCLINISDIAACFQPYATTPLNNLIKKLQPAPQTEAALIGNLAGQLLDEEVNMEPEKRSYPESVRKFFRSNAFNLLATNTSADFHKEAQRQKENIRKAFAELPNTVNGYDRSQVILEPSFFSQMLGIQGRMDLMQQDFKFLIEQKSGKSAFPYPQYPDDTPKPQEAHYVQLLLYMALLRYNYGIRFEDNSSFLLYSKYPNSLCRVGTAPELVFNAIKIRNGIASAEDKYANGDFAVLDELTPEKFRQQKVADSFWERFSLPSLKQVLDPIHDASEQERKYFYRMLTFVANEHLLAKVGSNQREDSGLAAIWQSILEEKRQSGNIFTDLRLVSPSNDHKGAVEDVVLRFEQREDNGMCNFRKGDIAILYPYQKGGIPDACHQIVNRCTITDIQLDTVTLHLRVPQSNARLFLKDENSCWAVEHDFMESSYSSQYRGIHSFLTATKRRRDLILMQREPEIDASRKLIGDYGDFNTLALRVKQAKDLFLIIGPPGTGKTSYGMLNTLKEEWTNTTSSVMIASYTNRAVDEICSKLVEEGIDFIRIGSPLSADEAYHPYLLGTKVGECANLNALRNTIASSRVIVGTTTAFCSHTAIFSLKRFDLLIVDEASQILEPHLLPILSAKHNGESAIRKIVMIGDHKQLPAVVKQTQEESRVDDAALNAIHLTDCRLSLFERLLKKYGNDERITFMLTHQGRMHRDIAMFPNVAFYENKLNVVPLGHQLADLPLSGAGKNGILDLINTRRIVFIDVPAPDREHYVSDKVNQAEAEVIAATVVKIYEKSASKFDVNMTVGVIVPYRNQIATVRNAIDKYGIPQLHDITIDTVERYQGSQRDHIIYGFTIQKYYQLQFLTNQSFEENGAVIDRKLNVAITRARKHLIMVGNAALLANDFVFYKLIEFVRSRHGYFEVPLKDYVNGNFKVEDYQANSDISEEVYTVSPRFAPVYNRNVVDAIKTLPCTEWPNVILGREMSANLDLIGYGYSNFSQSTLINLDNQMVPMRPEWQVLLYCYYIMRQHYCSSKNIYDSYRDTILQEIKASNGRIQFIDIGCGPATCGISFGENFLDDAPQMLYTGVDVSKAMKDMARQLIEERFSGKLRTQFIDSFNNLSEQYWDACSEVPSLFIINISYFFSNVKADFTEQLALKIKKIIEKYPLNRYMIFIQHSERDTKLVSYKTFRSILRESLMVVESRKASFSYQLSSNEKTFEFCYAILSNY